MGEVTGGKKTVVLFGENARNRLRQPNKQSVVLDHTVVIALALAHETGGKGRGAATRVSARPQKFGGGEIRGERDSTFMALGARVPEWRSAQQLTDNQQPSTTKARFS